MPIHGQRLDSAGVSAFFERELEHIIQEPFDVKRAPLKAVDLVPIYGEVERGAETVTYRQFEHVGIAQWIKSYASDLPRADVQGREFVRAIKELASSFGYTEQELEAAMFAGRPLDQHKAVAAERAIATLIDEALAFGNDELELVGLLNQPNALEFDVPGGEGGGSEWEEKAPLEVLADMHGIARHIHVTTREVERPDTLLLPPSQFDHVATTPLQQGSDTTILQHFLNASQYITNVDQWHRLEGAGEDDADRMVCYRRSDDAIRGILPIDFDMLAPQPRGLEWVVPARARCGGVIAVYPLSIAYGDGI